VTLGELNALPAAAAETELLRCCGSLRWAQKMAASRPFASVTALGAEADRIWVSLDPGDWLEAFAAHPRIGERARETRGTPSRWSAEEQSGALSAAKEMTDALARGNEAYERRFGFIFLMCATGKSARGMLDVLNSRLRNAPDEEIRVAAEEQRKIMALRLRKLVTA
jgi:OHCU decarboxylase